MRAIGAVIAAAVPAGVSVAVCGELAGTVDGALALVGLGVHELSMDPGSIDRVRLALSESSVADLRIRAEELRSGPPAG